MRNLTLTALTIFAGCILSTEAVAQSRSISAQEYIESTSPLSNGGAVTSRSTPGSNVQTVTSIANLPVAGSSAHSVGGAGSNNSTASNSPGAYPYPASTPPRLAGNFATGVTATGTGSFRQTSYQTPSLGLAPVQTNRVAQNCNCATPQAPPQFYQPPVASQTPALGAPPTIDIQVPGQPGFQQNQIFQPSLQLQPGIGTPQFGATTGGSVLTPFLTGSGRYTPILNFRNMPPGTYLGQGIIGQPTAYVDGQPLRNLLRYVSP